MIKALFPKFDAINLIVLIGGIAIGCAAGFLYSSGVGFDRDSGARFLGAFLGSVITVSGALYLYYRKEADDSTRRVSSLKENLEGVLHFHDRCVEAVEAAKSLDEKVHAFRIFQHQFRRTCRLAERYQFEDTRIGHAYGFLSFAEDAGHTRRVEEIFDDDDKEEHISRSLKNCRNVSESALEEIQFRKGKAIE